MYKQTFPVITVYIKNENFRQKKFLRKKFRTNFFKRKNFWTGVFNNILPNFSLRLKGNDSEGCRKMFFYSTYIF